MLILTLAPLVILALIRIKDNGPGIPGTIKDQKFDTFFTGKEVGRGSGQGLAIAMM